MYLLSYQFFTVENSYTDRSYMPTDMHIPVMVSGRYLDSQNLDSAIPRRYLDSQNRIRVRARVWVKVSVRARVSVRFRVSVRAVSYTHLTLPTILRV